MNTREHRISTRKQLHTLKSSKIISILADSRRNNFNMQMFVHPKLVVGRSR